MAHLGEDVPPFSAPVETGPKGRGDQERSQSKRNRDGDWSMVRERNCGLW